ncbi:MAG: hypothetical protein LBR10_08815 [Prevotellaceae bacterium]|jgi:hypothetical protein|nr:hypothetical protein [Prevotellaceae bacterium]
MKNKIDIIQKSIILTLVIICAVFIVISRKKTDDPPLTDNYEKLVFLDKLSIENECTYLSDTLKIRDLSGNVTNIRNIASRHRYVYRFPVFDCAACVEKELKELKTQIEKIDDTDIFCLFIYGRTIRDILLFFNENKINCSVYITEDSNIGLSIDKYNTPYYFYLGNDLMVSNIFIPTKWNRDLYDFYMTKMAQNKLRKSTNEPYDP